MDYELNVQGAIESVALYDSDGSKVLDCEGVLDGHGNTVSLEGAPEDAASYEVAYDGMGRPVRIDVFDGGDNGGRFEYAYSEDGSYTVDRFGPDGEKVWTRSYDTEGTVLSTTVGDRFDLVYEDGFLASCNGEDCQIERDDQGRVVAMTLPSGVWGPVTEGYCDVYGYANGPHWITTICFEYDGNGNISRVYAPWTKEGKKSILSYFSYRYRGGDEMSLDEMQLGENIFDIRLSYEAIDAPTPLVRTLGGNVFDGSVDHRLGY